LKSILAGLEQFQREVYPQKRELFRRLAKGQSPETLFIGCSDSRVDPNMLTSTEPGDLFVLRNAGNVVPPYGASTGGEAAAVEYAVQVIGVKQILVCGHTHCGAVQALLDPGSADDLPALRSWLRQLEGTRRIVNAKRDEIDPEDLLEKAVQANVLVQLANLSTHPVVAARLLVGDLELIGCVYWIETGVVAHTVGNAKGGWDWISVGPGGSSEG
jgi:carbonic anhydrase